jgi:hypothetical protein
MEEEDCIQQIYYRMCVWWTRIVYKPIYYGSVDMEKEDSTQTVILLECLWRTRIVYSIVYCRTTVSICRRRMVHSSLYNGNVYMEEEEYGIQPSILTGVFIWKRRMVYSHSPLYYRSV